MLVRIEPVELLACGQSSARGAKYNVAFGAEEEPMTALILVELGTGLPVFRAEPLLAKQLVGVRKPIGPEGIKQVFAGVIGGPDLVSVLMDRVAIHACEDEILRAHEGNPLFEVRDGGGRDVVE